jgi:hypothetical protein
MKALWVTCAVLAILLLGLLMIALEVVIWPFKAVKDLASRAYNFVLDEFEPL